MARTFRKHRKSQKKLRDGTCQYASVGCSHNNACSYCVSNRTHRNRRREPVSGE